MLLQRYELSMLWMRCQVEFATLQQVGLIRISNYEVNLTSYDEALNDRAYEWPTTLSVFPLAVIGPSNNPDLRLT